MNHNGQINWVWIIIVFIILILFVLSKIPSKVEFSTGVSDEHFCYLSCENNFYIYTEGIKYNQTIGNSLTKETWIEEKSYNCCECRASLLNKLTRWILNKK